MEVRLSEGFAGNFDKLLDFTEKALAPLQAMRNFSKISVTLHRTLDLASQFLENRFYELQLFLEFSSMKITPEQVAFLEGNFEKLVKMGLISYLRNLGFKVSPKFKDFDVGVLSSFGALGINLELAIGDVLENLMISYLRVIRQFLDKDNLIIPIFIIIDSKDIPLENEEFPRRRGIISVSLESQEGDKRLVVKILTFKRLLGLPDGTLSKEFLIGEVQDMIQSKGIPTFLREDFEDLKPFPNLLPSSSDFKLIVHISDEKQLDFISRISKVLRSTKESWKGDFSISIEPVSA